MKRALILLLVSGVSVFAQTYNTVVILKTVNTSPWSIPANFSNIDNKIEAIGRGGTGSERINGFTGGKGGGGGAYSVLTNVNLGTPGSGTSAFQIGSKTLIFETFIKNASGIIQVQADYGRDATTSQAGNGGIVSNNIPVNNGYPGGNGVAATSVSGSGGGGAAGPNGEGSQALGTVGGAADNSMLAGQTALGESGYNGSEWGSNAGCGSGGAGGLPEWNGGAGGLYGGGGGGSGSNVGNEIGGQGGEGLIVISYNSTALPTPTPTPTTTPGLAHKNKMFLAPRP